MRAHIPLDFARPARAAVDIDHSLGLDTGRKGVARKDERVDFALAPFGSVLAVGKLNLSFGDEAEHGLRILEPLADSRGQACVRRILGRLLRRRQRHSTGLRSAGLTKRKLPPRSARPVTRLPIARRNKKGKRKSDSAQCQDPHRPNPQPRKSHFRALAPRFNPTPHKRYPLFANAPYPKRLISSNEGQDKATLAQVSARVSRPS
jgi:hypothetical protein